MKNYKEVTKWYLIPHKVMHHKFVKKIKLAKYFRPFLSQTCLVINQAHQ